MSMKHEIVTATSRVLDMRQFKLRMSEALYKHSVEHATVLDVTLSQYTRDALAFLSYAVDQVSNGGAVAFLDKEGSQRGEFWMPQLTHARVQGKASEK
jgi:hypothetical protein